MYMWAVKYEAFFFFFHKCACSLETADVLHLKLTVLMFTVNLETLGAFAVSY